MLMRNFHNAAGQKLSKSVAYGDTIKLVTYLDGFQTEERGSRTPKKKRSHKTNDSEQNHSTSCASFNFEIFNFKNFTCPFGLRHEVHYPSSSIRDFRAAEGLNGGQVGDPVSLVNVTETGYQYKYNDYGGKSFEKAFDEHTARSAEWQDELGLDWYDYGWRNYDPALGRWMNMDPLAEKFYPSSTYNYTVNNPILLNDPDGRDWSIKAKKDKDGNWQINITVNAAVVNNSGKEIDLDNYIKEQTAQFNRIFSFEGEGVSITANLNMRAISSEDDVQGSEHLIAIGDSKNFASDVGGHADYGGLRVDINGGLINKDGTTDYNNTLSHEIGHTGGLIHPFSNNEKVSFFSGYTWFGLKENRTEASIYKQKVGIDLSTNFMSYPQKYYKYNASTVEAQKLKNVLANPGRISGGQVGALIRYYSKGLLNKDNR